MRGHRHRTLRAAFVQAQAQIMNNGEYTPVVVIDKGMALELLDGSTASNAGSRKRPHCSTPGARWRASRSLLSASLPACWAFGVSTSSGR